MAVRGRSLTDISPPAPLRTPTILTAPSRHPIHTCEYHPHIVLDKILLTLLRSATTMSTEDGSEHPPISRGPEHFSLERNPPETVGFLDYVFVGGNAFVLAFGLVMYHYELDAREAAVVAALVTCACAWAYSVLHG
ncbi:hypothetical protein BDV96DRAFT_638676 [Lophiotrema nucula]|uniref:Uncharacterized protein n=1 Tax=Lophiotrema nucula TaxID=690887 RepID=A0A6A5YF90_9PLEO|nr:hypothetical protein BDV96DRAFT_638676 [Lophiotrema nucula]